MLGCYIDFRIHFFWDYPNKYRESKEYSWQVTGLVKISVVLSPFDSSFRDGYFQSVEIFFVAFNLSLHAILDCPTSFKLENTINGSLDKYK